MDFEWREIGYDSSAIEKIGHDGNDLHVKFKNGRFYRYFDVPIEIYHRILNKECVSKREGVPSYGATLDALVKKADYRYEAYDNTEPFSGGGFILIL